MISNQNETTVVPTTQIIETTNPPIDITTGGAVIDEEAKVEVTADGLPICNAKQFRNWIYLVKMNCESNESD